MNYNVFAQDVDAEPDHESVYAASTSQLMAQINDNDLMSILSARKYPVPAAQDDQHGNSDRNLLESLSFDFEVDGESSAGVYGAGAEGLESLIHSHQQQPSFIMDSQSSASSEGKTKAPKRRATGVDEGPKERRKKQIREAQRAYRLRKESRISFLTKRVSQLEQIIEDMSTTIASFSDSLLQSGVLAPHANLTQCTRETLEKCLHLAKTSNLDEDEVLESSTSQSQQPKKSEPDPTVELVRQPNIGFEQYMKPLLQQPLSPLSVSGSEPMSYLQCSTFMDQLHMAILYRGYLTLTNPSISADGVRQKFRLLYPAMERGLLASYFAAALHAKISKSELGTQWRVVPFFQLGGAGTHYAWPPELGPYTRRSRQWQAISVPLSHFSADIQKDLNGDWFDMQDLECFLLEKQVKLVSAPGPMDSRESENVQRQTLINARKLLPALLHKTICLGRSAGFRRSDVEAALSRVVLL